LLRPTKHAYHDRIAALYSNMSANELGDSHRLSAQYRDRLSDRKSGITNLIYSYNGITAKQID